MGKKKSAPMHPGYEQFKDTPWIKQGREIANAGGQGILDNYQNVNVFNDQTNRSLEARNNATYKRAFDNMERQYTNTMNKYAANNYNRFGTLNATPASFVTDNYQRQFQNQMNDLAYNQAMNYDRLRDAELSRRYDVLNMMGNMYQYGQTPHQMDIANWNTRNTNRNIMHENAVAKHASDKGGGWQGALGGAINGASAGSAFGPWGALGGAVLGGIGGAM